MEEKANYELLFNICMKSYTKATAHLNGLAITLRQDAELVRQLPCEPSVFLKPYDHAVGRLSAISEIIRKFNLQMDLSDLPLHTPTTTTTPQTNGVDNQLDKTTVMVDNAEDDKEPVFNFDDIGSVNNNVDFSVGHEGQALVSHVKDTKEQLFYLVDCDRLSAHLIRELTNYPNSSEELQKTMPPSGCVIGVYLDGDVHRAVREVVLKSTASAVNVHLIDLGEVVKIAFDEFRWYHLPRDLQQIPPQAIPCKLHKVHGFNGICEVKDTIISYKVISKDGDILCVDVSPINATTVQPIVRMIHLPSNPFAADLMNDNVQPAVQSVASVQLTADERSELFTDTGCTQNAMVAVMGYSPQDDKRICQFYDPKTGGCFKGGKCRLEHVAKLEDGWTRDKMLCKIQTRVDMPLIAVGSHLKIITTHVIGARMFYAQLTKFDAKLLEINMKINEPEYASTYKQLRQLPGVAELVLARYSDGHMYRGQVTEIVEDRVIVFYVDFGNSDFVELSDLYSWDDRFDFLPFQAYPMRLDSDEKWLDEPRTVERFRRLVLNKTITAHVKHRMNNNNFVRLIDNDGFDIVDVLKSLVSVDPFDAAE